MEISLDNDKEVKIDDSPIMSEETFVPIAQGDDTPFTGAFKKRSSGSLGKTRRSDRNIKKATDVPKSGFCKEIDTDEVLKVVNSGIAPADPTRAVDSRSRSQVPDHSFGRGSRGGSFIKGESVSPKGSGRCIMTTPGITITNPSDQQLSTAQARKDMMEQSGEKYSQTGLTSEMDLRAQESPIDPNQKSFSKLGLIPGGEDFQSGFESLVKKLKIMKIDKMREGYLQKRTGTINFDDNKRTDKKSRTIRQSVVLDFNRITMPAPESQDALCTPDSPLAQNSGGIEKALSGMPGQTWNEEDKPGKLQEIDPWNNWASRGPIESPKATRNFERRGTRGDSGREADQLGFLKPSTNLVEKFRPKQEELSGVDLSLLLKIILEAGKINELINNEFATKDSHLGFFLNQTNYQIEDAEKKEKKIDITHNFLSSHETDMRNIDDVSNEFSLDFFTLQETKGTNTMIKYMRNFFKQYCVLETFGCDEVTFTNYLGNVYVNYYDNSYHNAIHAMDVVNSAGYMVSCGLLNKIPQFEILALLIASYAHDVGHPGVNQSFLIEIKSGEATIYNDKSILENMHSALAFKLLTKPNSDFTQNLSTADYKKFRKMVIEMILATDLAQHMMWFTKFKNSFDADELDLNEESNRQLLLNIIIKSADIGHGAKKLHLHKRFSRLIIEEFYEQGVLEASRGFPVSKLCDKGEKVAQSQKGFLNFLVVPMYEYLGRFLKSEKFDANILNSLRTNVKYWEEQIPVEEKNGVTDFMLETNEMFENWARAPNKMISPLIKKFHLKKNSIIMQIPTKKKDECIAV